MRYTCTVVDNVQRERPLVVYTHSLQEAKRWSKELVRVNPTSKVEIYETRLILVETIMAQQTAPPARVPSEEQTDSH